MIFRTKMGDSLTHAANTLKAAFKKRDTVPLTQNEMTVKSMAAAVTNAKLPEPTPEQVAKAGGGVLGYISARRELQRAAMRTA